MRVDLVGVFPPPLGGISVHLQRLARRLERAGVDVVRHGPQLVPPFFGYHLELLRSTRGADVVHAHLHGVADLALLGLLARTCRRVVLTVHAHNVAGEMLTGRPVRAASIGAALRSMRAVVCVNPMIVNEIAALDVPRHRIVLAPAFLPPSADELLAEEPLPEVAAFLGRHGPVLAANAFTFDLYRGRLLYGQDQLVELLARLVPTYPAIGLVVHVSREDKGGQLALVRERARELGVADRILWVLGSRPFGPTLVRSDVMVRPTATDGDAVSVREALHLGIPVVASAVVERPEGTLTARDGDLDALVTATLRALELPPNARRHPQPDPFEALLALYREVSGA